MKALIPVAGNGTRLAPLGINTSKCLLPILNKPLLLWKIETLAAHQITEIILIVSSGEFGRQIQEFATHLPTLNPQLADVKVTCITQTELNGTAHAVQQAKDLFAPAEPFLFLAGDDLYGPNNIAALVNFPGLAVLGQPVTDPEKWGILQADDQANLLRVVEKPTTPVGNLASIGCMKLDSRIFDLYDQLKPSPRGEFELTDSLQLLAEQVAIKVMAAADYWIPVGYPWHVLTALEQLAPQIETKIEGTVEEGVTIKGKVQLPKSSSILAGTYIEGNVAIGEHTIVGPNARLRDNVSIGHHSRIGFGVEIKNSQIGDRTFVPHLSYVGDSILGDDVNFAGGAITSNVRHDFQTIATPIKGEMVDSGRVKFGTVIGDRVKLGIGTLIYPGRKIWPGLTTKPGQVVDKDITE